jgi:hypothetical protein
LTLKYEYVVSFCAEKDTECMRRVYGKADSICPFSLSEVVPVSTPKPEQYIMNELFVLSDVMSTSTKLYIAYYET